MNPKQINPVQWQHALGLARQTCARVFRDGGAPADALDAFGIALPETTCDWQAAVETNRAVALHADAQASRLESGRS